jgi:hypothetical protein
VVLVVAPPLVGVVAADVAVEGLVGLADLGLPAGRSS